MAHNTRVFDPPVVFAQTIGPAELNALDVLVSESVNGDMGGVWAPVTPIIIGGAGFQVTGTFDAPSANNIGVAGTLSVGGSLALAGNMIVSAPAIVQWQAGSFLTAVAGSTVSLGGTTNLSGTPQLTGATTLGISPARAYQRARVSVLEIDGGIWARSVTESESWPLVAVQGAFTTGLVPEQLGYEVDAADGATITSVHAAVQGAGAAHTPTNPPVVSLYKINLATSAQTLVGSQVDPAAGAAYIVNHDITISGLADVVDRSTYQYVVRIQGEGAAGGVLGLRVCAPRVFTTRAKVGEE